MATEAQERVGSDINSAGDTEWATRADVERVESKVQNLMVEVGRLQVGQKWIAWILGAMCAALMAIFGTLVVIAPQL